MSGVPVICASCGDIRAMSWSPGDALAPCPTCTARQAEPDPSTPQSPDGTVARILALLDRGRTDGGEAITSAKHAADVIRRDVLAGSTE